MNLLDLPPEIFEAILIESVRVRGVKRGVRLRLVNKHLSQKVVWAISESGILDNHCNHPYRGSPPSEYILYRARGESKTVSPAIQIIRRTADSLCSAVDDRSEATRHGFLITLCTLAADRRRCMRTVLSIERKDTDGDDMEEVAMLTHLYAAASYLNMPSVADECIERGCRPSTSSSLFGKPFELAAMQGNDGILFKYLDIPRLRQTIHNWHHPLRGIVNAAAANGHLEIIRTFLQTYSLERTSYKLFYKFLLHTAIRTPSLEIFEEAMVGFHKLEKVSKEGQSTTDLKMENIVRTQLFKTCVYEGWTTMAIHLLSCGVSVDLCRENSIKAPLIDQSSFAHACRKGYSAMVRILLNHGLNSMYAISYAASGGHLNIVKILLDHGCDPNEGWPPPIYWAVNLEHEAMLDLLKTGGAVEFAEDYYLEIAATTKRPVRRLCHSCCKSDEDSGEEDNKDEELADVSDDEGDEPGEEFRGVE